MLRWSLNRPIIRTDHTHVELYV